MLKFYQTLSYANAKISTHKEICTDDGMQVYPTAVWNSEEEEYFAVWHDLEKSGIYGVRIKSDGSLKYDPFEIKSIEGTEGEFRPLSIAYDSSHNQYLVAWHDDPNSSLSDDICAALVPFDGNKELIKHLDIPKADER